MKIRMLIAAPGLAITELGASTSVRLLRS